MSTKKIEDRQRFARNKLAEMATLDEAGWLTALRQLMDCVLEFTPVNSTTVTVDNPLLPPTATVVAELTNEFGPDYTAVHFDLSDKSEVALRPPHELIDQVQAANSAVQQHAGEERYPLMIFTSPGGIQFITGDPVPGESHRLQDITQAVFYWSNVNSDAAECLSQVGAAIVNGSVPHRIFKVGFNPYFPAQCRHCGNALSYWDDFFNVIKAWSDAGSRAQNTPPAEPPARQRAQVAEPTGAIAKRVIPETKQAMLFREFDKVWNGNSLPTIDDFASAHARVRGRKIYQANTRRQLQMWCATREGIEADNQKELRGTGQKTDRYRRILSNKSDRRLQY